MKIAVVRIRGVRKVAPRIRKTFEFLRLNKPNHCVVVDDTPQNKGMIESVKDFVTYGPVDEATLLRLLKRKGRKGSKLLRTLLKEEEMAAAAKEIFGGKRISEFADPVFRLRPPSKGYKDIKLAYPAGDLGRREDISPLLRRML